MTFWLSSTAAIAAGTEPSEPLAAGTSTGNRAIWTEPLPLLLTPLGYTGIVVGANLPIGPGNDLVLETMPFFTRKFCDWYCDGRGLFLAVGTAFKLGGGDSRDGFFLQPKLVAHVAEHSFFDDSSTPGRTYVVQESSVALVSTWVTG